MFQSRHGSHQQQTKNDVHISCIYIIGITYIYIYIYDIYIYIYIHIYHVNDVIIYIYIYIHSHYFWQNPFSTLASTYFY